MPASPLARYGEPAVWTDPGSGYVRRAVSPPGFASPIQLVVVHFPAGARVAFETGPRNSQEHQQVWVLHSTMVLTVGTATWQLHSVTAWPWLWISLWSFLTLRASLRVMPWFWSMKLQIQGDSEMVPLALERLYVLDAERLGQRCSVLLDCVEGGASVGFMQPLCLDQPDNQARRADLCKMLVHRRGRRKGLGAALMHGAVDLARECGKQLLVLDTASVSDAERLYARLGWQRVGAIPNYAHWPDGDWIEIVTNSYGLGRRTDVEKERWRFRSGA